MRLDFVTFKLEDGDTKVVIDLDCDIGRPADC